MEQFAVSENFVYRKILCIRRGYHKTRLKNFCLTVPIKFVEHFCVSKEFWYRKFSCKGGGKLHGFVEFFLSHRTEKTSPGNHYVFQKISGREKIFMDKRGGGRYHDFPSKSFCLTVPKYFIGEHFCVSEKIFLTKIFMHRRGGITVLPKFFVSQDRNEKLCKGTLLFSRKFLVSKTIYG